MKFTCVGLGLGLALVLVPVAPQGATMLHSSVLLRHGIITPKATIPNSNVAWPNSKLLTGLGVKEMFVVGTSLRNAYGSTLLGGDGIWDPSTVYVRSSAMDRSNQGAQCVALGLYPLGSGPSMYQSNQTAILSIGNEFQPVAVHTVPDGTDSLLRAWTKQTACVKYRDHLKVLVNDPLYADKAAEHQEFLARIQNSSGYKADEPLNVFLFDINSLQEALSSEQEHGFPFLGQATPEISQEDYLLLKELGDWNYVQQFRGFGPELGGAFVSELLSNFDNVVNGNRAPKLAIYSGHQRTFFGVEYALNIVQGRVPPTGYRYAFELFENDESGEHSVKITGIDLEENTEVIAIPDCSDEDGLCALDTFVSMYTEVASVDFAEACAAAEIEEIASNTEMASNTGTSDCDVTSMSISVAVFLLSIWMWSSIQ